MRQFASDAKWILVGVLDRAIQFPVSVSVHLTGGNSAGGLVQSNV